MSGFLLRHFKFFSGRKHKHQGEEKKSIVTNRRQIENSLIRSKFLSLLFEVIMEKKSGYLVTQFFEGLVTFLRRFIFSVLSAGPIPSHIAFIMDGNRRYAKMVNLEEGAGHKLIQEKIEGLIEEESIVNRYGVRVRFIGNFELLSKPVKLAAKRAMEATARNTKAMLSICIAYTSTDEIVHAVEETCKEKSEEFRVLDTSGSGYGLIGLGVDGENDANILIDVKSISKHMRMADAPDPDIIIRTSGETRLSNFLLWQSASSLLYSPSVLWPKIGFCHLVRAILDFQRNFTYLEKKQKQN